MAVDALFGVGRKSLEAVHSATSGHGSFQLDAGLDVTAPGAHPAAVVAAVNFSFWVGVIGQPAFPRRRPAQLEAAAPAHSLGIGAIVHVVILWTALARSQARETKPTVKGGLAPANAVVIWELFVEPACREHRLDMAMNGKPTSFFALYDLVDFNASRRDRYGTL